MAVELAKRRTEDARKEDRDGQRTVEWSRYSREKSSIESRTGSL